MGVCGKGEVQHGRGGKYFATLSAKREKAGAPKRIRPRSLRWSEGFSINRSNRNGDSESIILIAKHIHHQSLIYIGDYDYSTVPSIMAVLRREQQNSPSTVPKEGISGLSLLLQPRLRMHNRSFVVARR